MKNAKIVIISVILLLTTTLFAGCSMESQTFEQSVEPFSNAYAEINEATEIRQTIEVCDGALAVRARETTFTKSEGKYSVTEVEKTLNEIGSGGGAYNEVVNKTEDVDAANLFIPTLVLKRDYFSTRHFVGENTFKGRVAASRVEELFGLAESHAEMKNVDLTLTLSGDRLASMTVNYLSQGYTVAVAITFAY